MTEDGENIVKCMIEEAFEYKKPGEKVFYTLVCEFQKLIVERALVLTSGNISEASRLLGIERNTIRKIYHDD